MTFDPYLAAAGWACSVLAIIAAVVGIGMLAWDAWERRGED